MTYTNWTNEEKQAFATELKNDSKLCGAETRAQLLEWAEKLENEIKADEKHTELKAYLLNNIHKIEDIDETEVQEQVFEKCNLSLKKLGFTKSEAIEFCNDTLEDSWLNESSTAKEIKSELITALTDDLLWNLKAFDFSRKENHDLDEFISTLVKELQK